MTEYIFFSGKGGVGKTTMAATKAVHESQKGKRTLLVSTDPAGNLGDIFEKDITPDPVEYADNLFIAQMDSQAITEAYKDKILEPLKEILDGLALEQVKEEFNSGCTVEIATFDKFTDFLGDDSYDLIVFDTAPTGHTLRLMTLPGEWNQFILKSAMGSGQTCIGPVSQIESSREKYEHAVSILQDPEHTPVYLVSRPEKTSVYETFRARQELERTGIHNFRLVINGVFPNHGSTKGIFSRLAENQKRYIAELLNGFDNMAMEVPMQQSEIKGLKKISLFGEIAFENNGSVIEGAYLVTEPFKGFASAEKLTDLLIRRLENRVIVITGKGGTGKTVTACATAYRLAQKGKTLLMTTDPAAHIGQVLETEVGFTPSQVTGKLWAVNIEQKQAVEDYRKRVINDSVAKGYSDELMESLKEELESPCTEEIAIFEQFAELLDQPGWDYFVLDTAPTGHTLRLLELPFEFKQQMDQKAQKQQGLPVSQENHKIGALIKRLKDPQATAFLLVAYPEFTPLHESYRAMEDLERVGINIQGIMLNNILKQEECLSDFENERWKLQQHYLSEADNLFTGPMFRIPLQPDEIVGLDSIEKFQDDIFNKNRG